MKLFSLPNILTLVNLFAGCGATVLIFSPSSQVGTLSEGLQYVPYFTLASLVADYFDGMAARFTKTQSGIGKELDSLADMVSFGLVPGAILYTLLTFYFKSTGLQNDWLIMVYSCAGFLVTLFSALRLAKFNLDERQSEGFMGLATPACTIFIIGLLIVFLRNDFCLSAMIINPLFLFGLVVLLSYLLIAEIPMFSFKFKSFGWAGNEIRYVFIIAAIVLLVACKFAGISLAVVLYVFASIVLTFTQSLSKNNISKK
jgi:CDP-diacylglycerol--serine O-phosphatidyltransferase